MALSDIMRHWQNCALKFSQHGALPAHPKFNLVELELYSHGIFTWTTETRMQANNRSENGGKTDVFLNTLKRTI